MTKTAAMHFGGPAAAASGGHPGGMGSSSGSGMGVSGGGGSGSSTSGRDVKPHQCQQCLKTFSSNHQLVQHIRVRSTILVYISVCLGISFVYIFCHIYRCTQEKSLTNAHIAIEDSSNCPMCNNIQDFILV